MHFQRAHSDPGPVSPPYTHKPLGQLPCPPPRAVRPGQDFKHVRPYVQRRTTFSHPAVGQPINSPTLESPTSRTITRPSAVTPERQECHGSCLLSILKAPLDFMRSVIKKWLSPSDDCMRCINITYWLVLIIGGIVSAFVALTR